MFWLIKFRLDWCLCKSILHKIYSCIPSNELTPRPHDEMAWGQVSGYRERSQGRKIARIKKRTKSNLPFRYPRADSNRRRRIQSPA